MPKLHAPSRNDGPFRSASPVDPPTSSWPRLICPNKGNYRPAKGRFHPCRPNQRLQNRHPSRVAEQSLQVLRR